MATCKDCIHCEICKKDKDLPLFEENQIAYCKAFKNTADVVEVVRCKDCKYFTKEMILGKIEFTCKRVEGMVYPSTNFYCSYGTPKERGGEK